MLSLEENVAEKSLGLTYFSVSLKKLVIMSFSTGGLYNLYWFYKNWKITKKDGGEKVIPWLRAIFSVYFCYSLFKRILKSARQNGYSGTAISAGGMATFYIIFSFVSNKVVIFSWLAVFPLLAIQSLANFNNLKLNPDYVENDSFSLMQKALCVAGASFYVFIIYGSMK